MKRLPTRYIQIRLSPARPVKVLVSYFYSIRFSFHPFLYQHFCEFQDKSGPCLGQLPKQPFINTWVIHLANFSSQCLFAGVKRCTRFSSILLLTEIQNYMRCNTILYNTIEHSLDTSLAFVTRLSRIEFGCARHRDFDTFLEQITRNMTPCSSTQHGSYFWCSF